MIDYKPYRLKKETETINNSEARQNNPSYSNGGSDTESLSFGSFATAEKGDPSLNFGSFCNSNEPEKKCCGSKKRNVFLNNNSGNPEQLEYGDKPCCGGCAGEEKEEEKITYNKSASNKEHEIPKEDSFEFKFERIGETLEISNPTGDTYVDIIGENDRIIKVSSIISEDKAQIKVFDEKDEKDLMEINFKNQFGQTYINGTGDSVEAPILNPSEAVVFGTSLFLAKAQMSSKIKSLEKKRKKKRVNKPQRVVHFRDQFPNGYTNYSKEKRRNELQDPDPVPNEELDCSGVEAVEHDMICTFKPFVSRSGKIQLYFPCFGIGEFDVSECCEEHDRCLQCSKNYSETWQCDQFVFRCVESKIVKFATKGSWLCDILHFPYLMLYTNLSAITGLLGGSIFSATWPDYLLNYDGRWDKSCLCGGPCSTFFTESGDGDRKLVDQCEFDACDMFNLPKEDCTTNCERPCDDSQYEYNEDGILEYTSNLLISLDEDKDCCNFMKRDVCSCPKLKCVDCSGDCRGISSCKIECNFGENGELLIKTKKDGYKCCSGTLTEINKFYCFVMKLIKIESWDMRNELTLNHKSLNKYKAYFNEINFPTINIDQSFKEFWKWYYNYYRLHQDYR